MKKIMSWLFILSLVIFIFDWGIIGIKLLDGDYDITLGAYIGLVCLIFMSISLIYIRCYSKCPYCHKLIQPNAKFCQHCGKKINKK